MAAERRVADPRDDRGAHAARDLISRECRHAGPSFRAARIPHYSAAVKILVVDIGGTNVKVLASGHKAPIKIPSGSNLTPARMAKAVLDAAKDWKFDAISIGYPGVVVRDKPVTEPVNLGRGWVGFNFKKAFRRPVRMINDAAMQALGGYKGGRMLFLGLGTGLGTALIIDGVLEPMELAHLPYKKGQSYEDYIG